MARCAYAVERGVDADEGDCSSADELGFARGLGLGFDDRRECRDRVQERVRGHDACTCVGDGGGEVERVEVVGAEHEAGDRSGS